MDFKDEESFLEWTYNFGEDNREELSSGGLYSLHIAFRCEELDVTEKFEMPFDDVDKAMAVMKKANETGFCVGYVLSSMSVMCGTGEMRHIMPATTLFKRIPPIDKEVVTVRDLRKWLKNAPDEGEVWIETGEGLLSSVNRVCRLNSKDVYLSA